MLPYSQLAAAPPAVSIVVPTYNAVATLEATAISLRAQTGPGWEAVFVDDGSTDETPRLLVRLSGTDGRFRCVIGPHRCPAAARNLGVSASRSPWVLFLDADDVLRPAAVETLLKAAAVAPEGALISAGYEMLASDGRPLDVRHFPASGGFSVDRLLSGNHVPPMAMLRRSLAAAHPLNEDPRIRGCEDWDLWLRLADRGTAFVSLPAALFGYRLRADSLSHHADRMFAAANAVLDAWLPRASDPAKAGQARHRLAIAYGAMAAAAGDGGAVRRFWRDLPHVIPTPETISAAASVIQWAFQFVRGADGHTWDSAGCEWRRDAEDWLARGPLAEWNDAILDDLDRQLMLIHSRRELFTHLREEPGDLKRIVIYGLGANGLGIVDELRGLSAAGGSWDVAVADDAADDACLQALELPIVDPRRWRRWPRHTLVVVTPNEQDGMCRTLEAAGGIAGRDFVRLNRLVAPEATGAT